LVGFYFGLGFFAHNLISVNSDF